MVWESLRKHLRACVLQVSRPPSGDLSRTEEPGPSTALPVLVQPTASLYTEPGWRMYPSVMVQVSWHGEKVRAICISMNAADGGAWSMVPFGAYFLSLPIRCVVSELRVGAHTCNSSTKLRQGDHEFQVSLGYIVNPCLKQTKCIMWDLLSEPTGSLAGS